MPSPSPISAWQGENRIKMSKIELLFAYQGCLAKPELSLDGQELLKKEQIHNMEVLLDS